MSDIDIIWDGGVIVLVLFDGVSDLLRYDEPGGL